MRFAFMLAYKHIISSKAQSILIIAAIALGAMLIIWVPAVNEGFYQELLDKSINTSAHIIVQRYDEVDGIETLKVKGTKWELNKDKTILKNRRIQSYLSVENSIKSIKGIIGFSPSVTDNATLVNGEKNYSVSFIGINYPQYQEIVNIDKDLVVGTYTKLNPDGIALSKRIAENLRLELNDSVVLSTTHAQKTFKVVALYDSGFISKDESTIYISMNTAQNLVNLGNQVDNVGVKVENPWIIENIATLITYKTGLEAKTWKDDNEALLTEIGSYTYIMFIMNLMIMLAIGAGVLGIMIVLVTSKHKQIGMLKALGVTSKGVIGIFVTEGFLLSIGGAVFGCLLGTLSIMLFNTFPMQISENYGVSELRAIYKPSIYIQAVLLSVVSGCLASFIPAYLSSKIDPAEVLKSS